MKSSYKNLGPYIREVSVKNDALKVELLLGVSITKKFIPSIANTVGTDMSKYKIVKRRQFAYGPVTSRNGEKISVALLDESECLVSTSYTVFEIINTEELDPAYLMMWFSRSEFDRYARYMSHGSVRELFGWTELCAVELPVPSIEKQRDIIREYRVVTERITLNEQLTQKLERSLQATYKQWFVNFEFPLAVDSPSSKGKSNLNGMTYKSSGGEMKFCAELQKNIPSNWTPTTLGNLASEVRKSFRSGGTFKTANYIGLEHMPKKSISLRHWDEVNSTGSNKSKFLKGNILFGKLRPYFHKVGVAFVDGICSTDIVVCEPKEEHFFGLVLAIMSSNDFVNYSNSGWSGTKMPRTNWDFMSKHQFPIPPEANLIPLFTKGVKSNIDYMENLALENKSLVELAAIINSKMATA
jgi:restriction endonuclease S subunit